MPNSAGRSELWALALILGITAWRLAWLPYSRLDLFVDESQYWLWGQEMAAGAWSKPPLVGWLIRLANEALGSSAAWVARAPWPLTHGLTAVLVMRLGRDLAGARAGALAGATYALLPAVSLGAILISTDSPQMLALAATLLLWRRLAQRPSGWAAVALGTAIAAGMWSKYAMLFPLAGLAGAAVADRGWRIAWRHAAIAAGTALLLFAPNVIWNLTHDLATVRHTAENANWQGGALRWGNLGRFLGEQLAVAGPLTLLAMLAAWPGALRQRGLRGLAIICAAPLAIVCAQALKSGANANWAVGAYVGGAVLMALTLAARPRLAALALGINGIAATGLPVLATLAPTLGMNGRLVMERYVGQAEASAWVLAEAARLTGTAAPLIVTADRALTADLFYRRSLDPALEPLRLRAAANGPDSHYRMIYQLRDETGPAVWVGQQDDLPPCAGAPAMLSPERGVWRGKTLAVAPLGPDCLATLRTPAP